MDETNRSAILYRQFMVSFLCREFIRAATLLHTHLPLRVFDSDVVPHFEHHAIAFNEFEMCR